jgi:hypothetical protein
MTRLVALEKLALPSSKHAVPYPFHVQESWPYWTNWPRGLTPQVAGDRTITAHTYIIGMHLVVGHLNSPRDSNLQTDTTLDAADVLAFFQRCPRLALPRTVETDDDSLYTPPRWMGPGGITIQSGGIDFFDIGNVQQVFVDFQLSVPLHVSMAL